MTSERHCSRCASGWYVKNGFNQGHQRYLCRTCGCNFTDPLPPHTSGKPEEMKLLALLLYRMGNASLRMAAGLVGVSATAVMNWVREWALHLPEPSMPGTTQSDVIILLDEMHHFVGKKAHKLWVWRAYDPTSKQTIAWVLGRRDDATLKKLLDKVQTEGRIFFTDDWEGYHRVIPQAQLYTGKDLTFPIEQDNSNIRHYLARFRRRTKVVSRSEQMIDLSRLYTLNASSTCPNSTVRLVVRNSGQSQRV